MVPIVYTFPENFEPWQYLYKNTIKSMGVGVWCILYLSVATIQVAKGGCVMYVVVICSYYPGS